jgi:hypothetical protein
MSAGIAPLITIVVGYHSIRLLNRADTSLRA